MTNAVKIVKDEIFDNKMAFGIVYKKLMSGEVSPEDFKKAKDQLLKNNAKILSMGALGALHGSVVVGTHFNENSCSIGHRIETIQNFHINTYFFTNIQK